MGMIGIYVTISQEEARQLAEGLLLPDDMNLYDRENRLDIDKAWQGIGFVLTGELAGGQPPLGHLVPTQGDRVLDFGDYGAFYLKPEEVAEVVQAISGITEDDFRERFNRNSPLEHEIYPVTEGEDAEEFLIYLYSHFTELAAYFRQAAGLGQGMLFYIA